MHEAQSQRLIFPTSPTHTRPRRARRRTFAISWPLPARAAASAPSRSSGSSTPSASRRPPRPGLLLRAMSPGPTPSTPSSSHPQPPPLTLLLRPPSSRSRRHRRFPMEPLRRRIAPAAPAVAPFARRTAAAGIPYARTWRSRCGVRKVSATVLGRSTAGTAAAGGGCAEGNSVCERESLDLPTYTCVLFTKNVWPGPTGRSLSRHGRTHTEKKMFQ